MSQHWNNLVEMSVNCEVEAKCLSVITVWQNRCELVPHHYAKAEWFPPPPPPPPPDHPSQSSSSCANPPNHIKRWLISMTTHYFPNQMIPRRSYLSPYAPRSPTIAHVHLCEPLDTLSRLVWSNLGVSLEESGPRHRRGSRGATQLVRVIAGW